MGSCGKPPAAGWCSGANHKPKVAAQSGYEGLCKACYRKKHPRKYQAKLMARKKQCSICDRSGDLQQGICRPCFRARRCEMPDCTWVNAKSDAV
eukprot:5822394-Karenia_brevis.AAC.1